ASEDRARSRISSGPMTDVEDRKNWERAVVDASITSTAIAAVQVGAAGPGARSVLSTDPSLTRNIPKRLHEMGECSRPGPRLARSHSANTALLAVPKAILSERPAGLRRDCAACNRSFEGSTVLTLPMLERLRSSHFSVSLRPA